MNLIFLAMALLATAVSWDNLDEAHHLGGRKVSEGYLRGKVVMICNEDKESDRLEAIWDGFKTRQFSMIGAFYKMPKGVTFPVYRGAALGGKSRKAILKPYYVVDPTGKIIYSGDDERYATDIIVGAITAWEFPRDARRWKRAIGWEVENQPAHAIIRFEDSAKDFPEAAKEFEVPVRALKTSVEMPQLLKLVRTVIKYNDYHPQSDSDREKIIAEVKKVIEASNHLKKSIDEQVAREAKNAIADLTWYIHEI